MKISLRAFRQRMGITNAEEWAEFLEECMSGAVVLTLCEEGCEAEPDGMCEHGCPSVLMVAGLV